MSFNYMQFLVKYAVHSAH